MVQPIYVDEASYLESRETQEEKLAAIIAIRAALLAQMLKVAAGNPVSEYFLNDGQTTIKRVNWSTQSIMLTRNLLETEANEIRKELGGGRMTRLVSSDNFTGPRYL